ncbi:hypothetical protein [Carboxylicivirga marina]|uniref:hypothetical protein n=1 Tax=Carboxylicivirga marina TaxID=2800988 RepID=UPI00259A6B8B|nr:hypothetical protein [uncultured Carboxylicivirga sp.]
MKAKIRFILIGFIIIIVPLGFIIKRSIAIDIQKEAIDLNQIGYFDRAMDKIDLAIRLAPRNYLFYATKAQFLEAQRKYSKAIIQFKKISEFKENYAEGFVAIGMNYERLEMTDSAKIAYNSALRSYNYRIQKYDKDRESLYGERLNRGFVYALLGDTASAKLEFDLLKSDYPEYVMFIEQIELIDIEKDFLNKYN